ncbi:hypothetical protein AB0O68_14390 [Streptomyces sp. NPDC087512]|uniref:hypothetical protein n=1 Tax=Streptomyces sp. NPDC087512 TaxID=3155059 RepID=UPI0034462967
MTTPAPGLARRRPPARAAALLALLLALTACGPHTYDDVPALSDVRRSEVPGSWHCVDGTTVVLHPDGKADIRFLDGQEWDFDDGWRLSGTGRWDLTDERTGWNGGRHVRLTLTPRTATTARTSQAGPASLPYTWTFELRRDAEGALELYFFFGDPDSRSTYVLQRTAP